MAKRIIQMRDRHKSTTNLYPKVTDKCLPNEIPSKWNSKTKGNFTGEIYFDEWGDNALAPVIQIKKDNTHKAELRVWSNNVLDTDIYGVEMQYQDGNDLATIGIDKDGILLSGINKDININTTGTSKLYINGVEYQAGGSQLYQHNITILDATSCLTFTIINDISTQMTTTQVKNYITTNFTGDNSKMLMASGMGGGYIYCGVYFSTYNNKLTAFGLNASSQTTYTDIDSLSNMTDTVITL